MRILLLATLLTSSLACGGSDEISSCAEAAAILAGCDGSAAAADECLDTGPAARFVAGGTCAGPDGKADWFGNRTWGEECWFNWQCQQDTRHACNHGRCYLRAEAGQACDQGDSMDCEEGLACADELSTPSAPGGVCSATGAPVVPALHAETPRPDEEREFQEHTADILAIQLRTALAGLNGDDRFRRTFHPKRHLCTTGTFQTFEAPADLAVGPVFSRAQAFPAYVRLSNGNLTMAPDSSTGVQGLAVKLVGVPGPKIADPAAVTQDFLLINLAANVVASANEFLELTKAQEAGGGAIAHYLVTHPRTALRIGQVALHRVASPRTEAFWSANASRHGEIAVKYSARPCPDTAAAAETSGDDFMRDEVKAALAQAPICFDFYAQRQTDAVAMSIEDATSVWDETASVPVRIGRIEIPQGELGTPASDAVEARCDELSFDPWNTALEHRPLGNMNRARRSAYEASKLTRRAAPEPTSIP